MNNFKDSFFNYSIQVTFSDEFHMICDRIFSELLNKLPIFFSRYFRCHFSVVNVIYTLSSCEPVIVFVIAILSHVGCNLKLESRAACVNSQKLIVRKIIIVVVGLFYPLQCCNILYLVTGVFGNEEDKGSQTFQESTRGKLINRSYQKLHQPRDILLYSINLCMFIRNVDESHNGDERL